MPPVEKHMQTSIERTGRDYADLHRWIDDPEKKTNVTISRGSGSSAADDYRAVTDWLVAMLAPGRTP
ncbi:MAG: hypothetical protein K6360_00250 [Deltaproteobacteria bacterium]